MSYIDKCDEYFANADKALHEKYIDVRFKVVSVMLYSEILRFFYLLYTFSESNKRDFISNLYYVVCEQLDEVCWMVFCNESKEEERISVEILDLIEGWLCTSEVSSHLDHERCRWNMNPIE